MRRLFPVLALVALAFLPLGCTQDKAKVEDTHVERGPDGTTTRRTTQEVESDKRDDRPVVRPAPAPIVPSP